jgi:HAD superfamily hydrolase (TIGR01509 family)
VDISRSQTVVFDVDGTLVDSNYFHVIAWQRAFRRDGRTVAAADIHRLIGMGGDQMLPVLVGAPSQRLEVLWHEEFLALRDEVQPTEGATDLVRAVAERGATVVYATSGKADDVSALRNVIGADRWVDHVVSSDDVEHSKPAADIFELALRRSHSEPSHTVVVGDTVWDVRAATGARLPCVGLTCGGISAHELRSAGAIAVFDSPAHLLERLSESPVGRLLAS